MGSKYRPSVSSAASHLDSASREQVLHDVTAPIKRFALGAESRIIIGMPDSMQHWLAEAMFQVRTALDSIPDGTYIQPPNALPYTHADDVEMKQFLGNFKGREVVCTSVDKADTTLIFACPKLYVDKLMTDLEEGGTYQPTTLTQGALLQSHNSFLQHHGIPIELDWQSMPFYFGTFKLHKPGMRFISSSNTSSMKTVSLWINRLLTQVMPDVDQLFADVLCSVGITAKWTQRSWILRNTAAAMPLIHN